MLFRRNGSGCGAFIKALAVKGVQPELGARERVTVNGTELSPGYSQPLHKELMQSTIG